jgi:hypothetical protein
VLVGSDGPGRLPGAADVAQLVEHHLAKVRVAGSNPVVRSRTKNPRSLDRGFFAFRRAMSIRAVEHPHPNIGFSRRSDDGGDGSTP